ncbi:MAG: 50S ribosomal protein L31 [Chloroflexi bacterium]|nr:50S ribosomal protein L31 [Chloroflexota bacterium]
MKSNIHPEYFSNTTVTCGCGATWVTSSTKTEIRTEICSKCHPFWTGEQRIVDTEGRVERMMRRYKLSNEQNSE